MRKIIVLILSCVGVQYLAAQEVGVPQVVDTAIADDFDSLQLDTPAAQKIKDDKEVIVVGYGTQKKSNVTGAISSVKMKDIENAPKPPRVEQILQGRVAGATVAASSGQPGSASTVRLRGLTSFGEDGNDPLWIVDGILVSKDIAGTINQGDIETIEVLKDAASAAIYGVRAAKGVIIITTKKGKKGRIVLGYNGYYGISSTARKIDVLNATEYASIINEKLLNSGGVPKYSDPMSLGVGTDWQDQIFNTASKTSHEISLTAGSEKSNFFASFGYYNQEGVVLKDISNYTRLNARLNSNHKVTDFLTIDQSFSYIHEKIIGIGNTNSEFGGPLSSAVNLDPITPVVENNPGNSAIYNNKYVIRDENGNPYGISDMVGQEMTNPIAYQQTRLGNYKWNDYFMGNISAELKFFKDFKFKTMLGGTLSYRGEETFTPIYYLSPTVKADKNNITRWNEKRFDWQIENTLTYSKRLDNHNFTLLLGQAAYLDNKGNEMSVTHSNLPINNHNDASFNFEIPATDKTGYSKDKNEHHMSSYFARLTYDYKDRYLFTGIIRRDGSTKFGPGKKYGYFPSVSLGWNVHKENFWKGDKVLNTLKIRGGYGVVGNDNIDDFGYAALINGGYNYTIGGNIAVGYAPKSLENPDLGWEETSQANIGLDSKWFNSITLSVDLYKKVTKDLLRPVDIPGYIGVTTNPVANVADMENRGIDIELGYKRSFGDFKFGVNGTFGYLENEMTNLGNGIKYITGGAGFQSMGDITRTLKGETLNSFFGYETAGIFQNQAEINAYTNSTGGMIQPGAKPGDFKWIDNNGDGKITDDDRVVLGNSLPKYTYGLTLNLEYKGFDFMVFGQGAAGYKVFQGLRRLDMENANYQREVLNRWVGEGTSNDYPRLTTSAADSNGNFKKMSNFYLQDGDYFRIKLIQLGYSLPQDVIEHFGATKVRFYLSAENLFTFTKYTGYDPEIGGGVMGVDRGVYPQARSFVLGANIQF